MSEEKSPLVYLTNGIVMPKQRLAEGSCPFITLNFLPTEEQWCAHAIIDSSREKSIISIPWITSIMLSYDKLDFNVEEINEKISFNHCEVILSVFLKDTNEIFHNVKLKFVSDKTQYDSIVLGNDFLCNAAKFHSITTKHVIMKDPKHSSCLIKFPIRRYSINL